MATILSLPETCASLEPEVLAPEETPVQEYHLELVRAAHALRKSLMRIAYYGFRLRMSDGWTAMGFESGPRGEDDYRESIGIPRSTWFRYVRVGQSLHQLPLEDLERIPITNAELLTAVDPSIQHDFSWVNEAKTLPPTKFAELVTERNKTVGAKEPLTTMVVKVPFLAKRAMEEMLEGVQHKYELSSKGQALELMIADLQHDANLLGTVNQARGLLDGVIKSMAARSAPETEEATWLAMAKEVLDAGYAEAVQAAREKTYRGKKDGGRA